MSLTVLCLFNSDSNTTGVPTKELSRGTSRPSLLSAYSRSRSTSWVFSVSRLRYPLPVPLLIFRSSFCALMFSSCQHAFLERFDTSLLRTLAVAQAIIAQDQRSCTAQLARVTQDLLTWAIDGLPDVPVRLVQEHPKLMRQFYERVAEQLANEPHSPGLDFDVRPIATYPQGCFSDH